MAKEEFSHRSELNVYFPTIEAGLTTMNEPYENPDDFGLYIGQVFKAIENYDLARHGLAPAEDLAPEFNFGAETHSGARAAIPVVRK